MWPEACLDTWAQQVNDSCSTIQLEQLIINQMLTWAENSYLCPQRPEDGGSMFIQKRCHSLSRLQINVDIQGGKNAGCLDMIKEDCPVISL
jgi:hypothetical protein